MSGGNEISVEDGEDTVMGSEVDMKDIVEELLEITIVGSVDRLEEDVTAVIAWDAINGP